MERLTTEMQQLITHTELGSPLEIYSPPTELTILGSIAVFGFTALIGSLLFTENGVNFDGIFLVLYFILISFVLGLIIIKVALSNRKKRAVICTFGVAFFLYEGFGSFRWKDVLTTTRQGGSKGGSLTYTVYCYDGRRIVFTGLIGMYMLAEAIDLQVARAQHYHP
jgi:hypothetical protein